MPLYTTVSEILAAVQDEEEYLNEARQQMESDFGMIFLEDSGFEPEDNTYAEFVDPAPQNFFNKVVDGANRALVRIAIKLPEDSSDDDKSQASDGELFIFGALKNIDDRLTATQEPPLRESIVWHGACRGWMAVRCIVHIPDKKTEVAFDVVPWDPMHMTWKSGKNGLLWAAYKRWLSYAEAYTEYGEEVAEKVGEKGAITVDWWDTEGNSIIVGSDFIKDNEPHGLDHVPVFLTPVGSMPTVMPSVTGLKSNDQRNAIKHRGQSVLHAWRQTIGPHNEEVSFIMDVARRARDAPLLYETESGTKTLKDDPYGSFKIISLAQGEKLAPIPLPPTPPESEQILSVIQRGRLEATLPQPISHGGSSSPESGIALAIRIDQTRSVYSPRTEGVARVYSWLCKELIGQTKKKAGRKSIPLSGFNSDNEFFRITMTPKQLDPEWFFDVRVEPRLPRDETEEANRFMMLTSSPADGEAGMSYETGREEILKIRNPAAEHGRVLREKAERLPPVQITALASSLAEQGNEEGARQVLAWGIQEGAIAPPEEEGAPAGPAGPAAPAGPAGPAANGTAPVAEEGSLEEAFVMLLDQIKNALMQGGIDENSIIQLLTPFVRFLDGEDAPTVEAIRALAQILVEAGQEELAQALAEIANALGLLGQTGPPQAPQAPQAPAPALA
jgi:hypothetical protein